MRRIVLFIVCLLGILAFRADKPAYRLFKSNGKKTAYKKLLKEAKKADFILFGELHNNPIAHWLQYELTKDLWEAKGNKLCLAAEMFEADGQLILDEYLAEQISEKRFEAEMRLWNNYHTDYKPWVTFAREHKIPVVASNIPRRYASSVFYGGFEALDKFSEQAKSYMAPLPIAYNPELPAYKKMTTMGGSDMHASQNFPKAQAIKDATMAHFITNAWQKGKLVLHLNGAFHSNNAEGICWYIKQKLPNAKVLTISTVEQDSIKKLKDEHNGLADFVVVVPTSMTNTY